MKCDTVSQRSPPWRSTRTSASAAQSFTIAYPIATSWEGKVDVLVVERADILGPFGNGRKVDDGDDRDPPGEFRRRDGALKANGSFDARGFVDVDTSDHRQPRARPLTDDVHGRPAPTF